MLNSQQLDDTLRIKSFEVIANRTLGQNPGLEQQTLQAANLVSRASYSLAELLSRESNVFIKSYSPGMLASPSIRGTGAAHTALVWNGLNLQSSMNGQLDLNLIPAPLFNQFRLQKGAQSSLWGSGSIGGTLFLEQEVGQQFSAEADQFVGSFGLSRTSFHVNVPGKIRVAIRAFTSSAQNDFEFVDITHFNRPLVKQNNAAITMSGVITDVKIQTGKYHFLELGNWVQTSLRHIPPIMSIPFAKAFQEDLANRSSANWTFKNRNHVFHFRGGYFNEKIAFNDSLTYLNAMNQSHTYIAEADWNVELSGLGTLGIGYNFTSARATADGYGLQQVTQNRQALFAQLLRSSFKAKLQTMAGIRKEIVESFEVPLIPFLSASFKISDAFALKGQWTKSFRVPTLNDLYWIPGGNLQLKPEFGRNTEVGIQAQRLTKSLISSISGTFFNSIVSNWILWTPGASYWSPQNVQEVNVNGVDLNATLTINKKHLSYYLKSGWQFASSQAIKHTANNQTSEGHQLIYVPLHTGFLSGQISYRSSSIELLMNHVGMRYTTTDNSSQLPGFTLANLSLSQQLQFKEGIYHLLFQINNIFNTTYQAIAWRAMPMRNYLVGIRFQFKPNKSQII